MRLATIQLQISDWRLQIIAYVLPLTIKIMDNTCGVAIDYEPWTIDQIDNTHNSPGSAMDYGLWAMDNGLNQTHNACLFPTFT